MIDLKQIQRKLTILNNYDLIFRGEFIRQRLPACCGKAYDLGDLLQMEVNPVTIEVEGISIMMLEVTCSVCGRVIPPEWEIRK